jgi:hypothetical protein
MYDTNMLNLILKAKNIKRKLLNTYKARSLLFPGRNMADEPVVYLKRDKKFNASQNDCQLATAALPDHERAVTGVHPSVKDFLLKETKLNATKEALELEKTLFYEEKSAWTTNMNAQKEKQALIRRGATILFRMHRLAAQQEKEQQDKIMQALEDGLLQSAQQELDLINRGHAAVIANVLTATATQATCAAASLDAKARANAISDRLTEGLDEVHCERLHIAELTEKVNVKSTELDVLVSIAKAERNEAHQYLQKAQSQVSRFSLAAEAIGLVQGQIESHAIQERERLSVAIDQERSDALEEVRSETQERLAAVKDARTAFEKLRETEKANLAEGYARVEHTRAVVAMERELVKKEMVRARLLSMKAEQERAASVDAKKAALDELQAARLMRNESRRALHKLAAIAEEMVIPKAIADNVAKNVTSTVEGQKNDKADSSEGMMFSFGFHIRNRRASSQAMSGTTSSVDGMESGREDGLQKRCTSLDIRQEDGSRSSTLSAISPPHTFDSTCSEADTSTSNLIDVTFVKPPTLCHKPSVAVDANPIIPIKEGHELSPFVSENTKRLKIHPSLEPSTERCDKQSGRMKLGNISNRTYY